MKGLLKWLFNKEEGDEDPIIIEDTEEPIVEIIKSPQFSEEVMKNISSIPKEMTKVPVQEVVKAPEAPKVEILPEVVVPEPPKVVQQAPRQEYYDDGFTSTSSLSGKRKR